MNHTAWVTVIILTLVSSAVAQPRLETASQQLSATQPATTQPAPAATTQPTAAAQASLNYFNQVCEVLDRALTQPAAEAQPSFYSNSANKINTLAKDNVDPQVVAWGGTVAMALTNASNALQVGQQRAESRSQSVATPGGYDANDPNRQQRAQTDVQNANQARRQGSLEERAAASERVVNLLANLQDARTKIAAQLANPNNAPAQPAK